jgi:hypothetical protein
MEVFVTDFIVKLGRERLLKTAVGNESDAEVVAAAVVV